MSSHSFRHDIVTDRLEPWRDSALNDTDIDIALLGRAQAKQLSNVPYVKEFDKSCTSMFMLTH